MQGGNESEEAIYPAIPAAGGKIELLENHKKI